MLLASGEPWSEPEDCTNNNSRSSRTSCFGFTSWIYPRKYIECCTLFIFFFRNSKLIEENKQNLRFWTHQYQYFGEPTVWSTNTCAIDYEEGNTLGKNNHITKCIIKINYTACARGPESFAKGREIWHKDWIALATYFYIISKTIFSF